MEPTHIQARRLSSGTMATLTGKTDYLTLDAIQHDFVQFCLRPDRNADYADWQSAWEFFWNK